MMMVDDSNESFNKYLFSTDAFLGTVVDDGDTAVKKMTNPCPERVYILDGNDEK